MENNQTDNDESIAHAMIAAFAVSAASIIGAGVGVLALSGVGKLMEWRDERRLKKLAEEE